MAMAQIKDKVVTAESLKALHEYNQKTYLPVDNPEVNGDLSVSESLSVGTNFSVDGEIILSSNQYGDELPSAGTVGRVFFKRLTDI